MTRTTLVVSFFCVCCLGVPAAYAGSSKSYAPTQERVQKQLRKEGIMFRRAFYIGFCIGAGIPAGDINALDFENMPEPPGPPAPIGAEIPKAAPPPAPPAPPVPQRRLAPPAPKAPEFPEGFVPMY